MSFLNHCNYAEGEIFPNRCSNDLRPLHYPSEKKSADFANHPDLKVFVPYLSGQDIVIFHSFPLTSKFLVDLRNVAKGAKKFNAQKFKTTLAPDTLKKRLEKYPEMKQNCNVRLAYKVNSMFLVKTYFTFGQRTVEPNTVHFYQTLNVPLHLFLKKSFVQRPLVEGFFPETEFKCYHQTIIPPHTRLSIPPGKTYFIISPQKNLFSVDILPADKPIELEFTNLDVEHIRDFNRFLKLEIPLPDEIHEENVEEIQPPTPQARDFFQTPVAEPPTPQANDFFQTPVAPQPVMYIWPNQLFDRTIQIVSPDFIQQYQAIQFRKLEAPPKIMYPIQPPQDPEVLDLSKKSNWHPNGFTFQPQEAMDLDPTLPSLNSEGFREAMNDVLELESTSPEMSNVRPRNCKNMNWLVDYLKEV